MREQVSEIHPERLQFVYQCSITKSLRHAEAVNQNTENCPLHEDRLVGAREVKCQYMWTIKGRYI